MSELMNKILADKIKTRKQLAALPFEEKLAIMEKIRQRSTMLAESPLRKQMPPVTTSVVVAGGAVVSSGPDAHKTGLTPPAYHPPQGQSNIRQNSETVTGIVRSQAGRSRLVPMVQTEFEAESQ